MLRLLVYITLFKVSIISSLPGYRKNYEHVQVIPNNRLSPPKQSEFHAFINSVLAYEECGEIPAAAKEDLYHYLEDFLESFVRKYCTKSRSYECARPQLFERTITQQPINIEATTTPKIVPLIRKTVEGIYMEPQRDETPDGNRRFGYGDGYKPPKKIPLKMVIPPKKITYTVTTVAPPPPPPPPPPRRRPAMKRVVKVTPIKIAPTPKVVCETIIDDKIGSEPSSEENHSESPTGPEMPIGSPPVSTVVTESVEFGTTVEPTISEESSEEIQPVQNIKEYITTKFAAENEPKINVNLNLTTTQYTESSEETVSIATTPPTTSYEISGEIISIEDTTTPPVTITTSVVPAQPVPNSRKSSESEEVSAQEIELNAGTDIPSPTLDNLSKDDIEKIWVSEYEKENVVTPPTIEDLGKIYKEGVVYLKEHPDSSPADLEKILLKNPNELVQYQEVISLLDDLKKEPAKLETEYIQVTTNDDEIKYKTAIAFLKLRQKGKPEKNKLLIEMLQKRARELRATEKMLKGKLLMLNEEYRKLNSAYGKIQKEEAETKDKVVVAVMKVPRTVDDGQNSKEEMEKVMNKFKLELEKNHQIVAEESVTVIQDNYSLTSNEKSVVINAASSGIDILRQGMYAMEFTISQGTDIFFKVFDQLPFGYLESEQKIFGLNPYQDQTKASRDITINPTRSLAAIRLKVLNIFERLTRGEIRVNKEKFFKYLIKILNLLIEKVKITPDKLIDNPQVSVFAAEESGNMSEDSEEQ